MSDTTEAVGGFLFGDPGEGVFAVLDGASVPGLLEKLHALKPEYECLYRGELAPDMAEVAPYLVRLERRSEMTSWILEQGWGKHWGIFAVSQADLRAMRQHFRRFLVVHDYTGKPMCFRFYDPRVLRTYLPTCNGEELAAFFGPVERYLQEDEDGGVLLRFRLASGALAASKEPLAPEKVRA
jgi:hypothetical protein